MMSRAGSTGTNVKRTLTWYEDMHSPIAIDGFGLFHEVLDISDIVGETAYQRLKDVGHFFRYSVHESTPAGHCEPEGGAWFVDFW